jgi:hypothetical protein
MNASTRLARRYHWHSATVRDFTCEPHGDRRGTAGCHPQSRRRARNAAQDAMLAVTREDPSRTLGEAARLIMPAHHDVPPAGPRSHAGWFAGPPAVAHDRELKHFADLLLVEKLGSRTLQSLALVAEVIHGTPTRFADPARFSFAHGGKDGHPFPVPLKVYDESIGVLRRSLDAAKIGRPEKLDGMKRLDSFVRAVESRVAPRARFDELVADERRISPSLDGRTVFDRGQLDLFKA